MVFVFLHLLALGNSSSNSFYARHVRYPFRFAVVKVLPEIIAPNVKTRQRPVILDGIGDALGALRPKAIAREVQIRQRPLEWRSY